MFDSVFIKLFIQRLPLYFKRKTQNDESRQLGQLAMHTEITVIFGKDPKEESKYDCLFRKK